MTRLRSLRVLSKSKLMKQNSLVQDRPQLCIVILAKAQQSEKVPVYIPHYLCLSICSHAPLQVKILRYSSQVQRC